MLPGLTGTFQPGAHNSDDDMSDHMDDEEEAMMAKKMQYFKIF